MNSEPADLDRDALVWAIRARELSVTSLSYLPVGAGSHHYLALDSDGRRWCVTVDELVVKLFGMMGPTFTPWVDVDLDAAFDVLDRAFRTAVALRQAGLEFVHAPITQPDGEVLSGLANVKGQICLRYPPVVAMATTFCSNVAPSREATRVRVAGPGSEPQLAASRRGVRLDYASDCLAEGCRAAPRSGRPSARASAPRRRPPR